MVRAALIVTVSYLAVAMSTAVAQIAQGIDDAVQFVPGDAFFSVRVTSPSLHMFSNGEDADFVELRYRMPRFRGPITDPNFPGFARLRLTGLDEADRDELFNFGMTVGAEVSIIRKDNLIQRSEENARLPLRVVVVNRDFDFETFHFFIRYNEHWMKQPQTVINGLPAGRHRRRATPSEYAPFVLSVDAFAEDWRNASAVPALKVQWPRTLTTPKNPAKENDGRYEILEPVSMPFADAAVVAFLDDDEGRIFRRSLNSVFYVLSRDGLHRYRWVLSHTKFDKTLTKEQIYVSDLRSDAE